MASIVCASYQLSNGTGVSQIQSFTDCYGNSCSVTVESGQSYIITASLTTFIPNLDLKVETWDTRYCLSFSSCCSNDVFHILGSASETFPLQIGNIGNAFCISEFTNPIDCTINNTLSLGCYTLVKIEQNIPSNTPLGNQMYFQTVEKFKTCEDCITSEVCVSCCNCYQIDLIDECSIEYKDCDSGKIIIVSLNPGTNYLCSSTEPIRITECEWTLTNLGFCADNDVCKTCTETYCITNTGNEYDDTYYLDGDYDGYSYWLSNSGIYYIYYNTTELQWCLSTSLGGFCILSGKSPCFSKCPDLCDEYFFEGSCPTTTTTTIACSTFDFEAIFDCLAEPSPTPSLTPTNTPTNTPTPSSTSYCSIIGVDVTIDSYTRTPTPTPTVTPSSTPRIDRPCNVLGDVSFTTIEGNISCPSSKQFQDCINGMMYYTTESVPTPSGDTLEQYMIFKAYVDGNLKCISYVGTTTDVIGVNTIDLVDGPTGYSNLGQCVLCDVVSSPTPTPTLTMTPTPSGTPCYCYELLGGKDSVDFNYITCKGVSTMVSSGDKLIPTYVCSLTTPTTNSLLVHSITKLGICVDDSCPPLTCKCYRVSNDGPIKQLVGQQELRAKADSISIGKPSSVIVSYTDCNNEKQIIVVNDYSSTQPFCSLTTPLVLSTTNITSVTLLGDCIDGNCVL